MDLAAEERFVASSFAAIAAREVAPLYAANFGVGNRALPSALKDVPLHIAPERNFGIDMSSGINVPTYYLSDTLYFSEIHTEDGSLDSCNLAHWGEPGAEKLWLFVHPDFIPSFNFALFEEVGKRKHAAGDDISSWLEGYSLPHHHKNIVVTPGFLQRHNIMYEVVCQRPRTLIYVYSGMPHQVLNTGVLLAEAVNVGGARWNSSFVQPVCVGRLPSPLFAKIGPRWSTPIGRPYLSGNVRSLGIKWHRRQLSMLVPMRGSMNQAMDRLPSLAGCAPVFILRKAS